MSIATTCRRCGVEFEPERQAIVAGTWRLCPTCRDADPAAMAPNPRDAEELSGVLFKEVNMHEYARNSGPSRTFRWTAKRLKAVALLAEDERSHAEIAGELSVNQSTLWRWKQHPDFAARLGELQGDIRAAMLKRTIAKKHKRIAGYDRMLVDAWAIVEARRRRYQGELTEQAMAREKLVSIHTRKKPEPIKHTPEEAATGWIVETEKVTNAGHRTVEWAFDAALWRSIESVCRQAAQELGQLPAAVEAGGLTRIIEIVGIDPDLI